ncbi:hypothetical protein Hanom_Chr05g00473771 [Helianthus anomalus]
MVCGPSSPLGTVARTWVECSCPVVLYNIDPCIQIFTFIHLSVCSRYDICT